jgi:hypothetical protein
MIFIENTIVSDELKTVQFCCDPDKCKGSCCVEGDAGAPLEEEEISFLEDHLEDIKPFMTPEGIREIGRMGVFDYDSEANLVTPLVNGRECAFVYFESGQAKCAIEKAYDLNKIPFRKPLSCHLYPVRISRLKQHEAVNYHKWHVCKTALEKGKHDRLALYLFLRDALIRRFGKSWFDSLHHDPD